MVNYDDPASGKTLSITGDGGDGSDLINFVSNLGTSYAKANYEIDNGVTAKFYDGV